MKKQTLEITVRKLRILLGLYVKRQGGAAEPQDMVDSRVVAKDPKHQKMFKEEPALELASIGLKYGPQKSALLMEWKKNKHSRTYWEAFGQTLDSPNNAMSQRKLKLMVTLQGVAKKMHKKDQSLWVRNCGRAVSSKLGPVMWLSYHGIIQKKKRKKKKKEASKN